MATSITMTMAELSSLIEAISGSLETGHWSDGRTSDTPPVSLSPRSSGFHVAGPLPDPWISTTGLSQQVEMGPATDPVAWHAAALAGCAIGPAIAQAQVAEVLPSDLAENVMESIRNRISATVDEWCGTGRQTFPIPLKHPSLGPWVPRPPRPNEIPLVLIRMGAHFQKAAEASVPAALRSDLEKAGERLFARGLEQLKINQPRQHNTSSICSMMHRFITLSKKEMDFKEGRLDQEKKRLAELTDQVPRNDAKIAEVRNEINRLLTELDSDRLHLQSLEEEYAAECS